MCIINCEVQSLHHLFQLFCVIYSFAGKWDCHILTIKRQFFNLLHLRTIMFSFGESWSSPGDKHETSTCFQSHKSNKTDFCSSQTDNATNSWNLSSPSHQQFHHWLTVKSRKPGGVKCLNVNERKTNPVGQKCPQWKLKSLVSNHKAVSSKWWIHLLQILLWKISLLLFRLNLVWRVLKTYSIAPSIG